MSDLPSTVSSIVDIGIYVDGLRVESPPTYEDLFAGLDRHPDGFAWAGLLRPSKAEMELLASQFSISPLLVEDAVVAHQRPKFERYGDVGFLVLRAADYIERSESVAFGELHVLVSDRLVITLRHSATPDLTELRGSLERQPELLAIGPRTVLLHLLDTVVDDYKPVVLGIENDIDEIETQVFGGSTQVSKRIYQLSREVIDFQRAVRPLREIIAEIRTDRLLVDAPVLVGQELRDIEDHAIMTDERVEILRETLKGTLDLNIALQTQRQNEEVTNMTAASLKQAEDSRKIAAWAGVLFVPSLVAGTYGMNFVNMPELHWQFGYLWGLGLMLFTGFTMYVVFKWRDWL
ncbi:magnesium transporter [Tessaracoccus bendigoensis DSM 12906]|uniref:Magnesium transporter n=1 Tax=Tessaracoccus bendigoensis DSM 12906 TaxID=1123357 RepID=A0A1M6LAH5_9ACTN|nr:magnesium and cobalt transport protein CorA [Tessaracoccus bendigoensis]SHJ68207.1 magnesium transporter [Tessaracoccus bendigoensis DSM 12906]